MKTQAEFHAGQVLNNITVLGVKGRGYYYIRCNTCGKKRAVQTVRIKAHQRKKLACYCSRVSAIRRAKTQHGKRFTPLYSRWCSMMERCYRSKAKGYARYGGRGIEVCKRWRAFENFEADMLAMFRPGLSLDRINVDQDYCKENCRWVSAKEQANNRSKRYDFYVVNGKRRAMTLKEAAKIFGIAETTLRCRRNRGWPEERLGIKVKHDKYEKDKHVLY